MVVTESKYTLRHKQLLSVRRNLLHANDFADREIATKIDSSRPETNLTTDTDC